MPTTILDVITSRIDQLTPQQQLTLKTASVVGRRFPHETVSAVYPVSATVARWSRSFIRCKW